MTDLVLYLGITAVGYFLGSKLREKREKLWWTGKVQTVAITILVLLMGVRMGSNKEIIDNLRTIGISAFAMTVLVILFSILAITVTRKILKIDRYGDLVGVEPEKIDDITEEIEQIEDESSKSGINAMTIYIIIAVAVGMMAGYFLIMPAFENSMESFDYAASLAIKIGLCLLLVFVGIDLGLDGTVIENIKTVGFRVFAIPLAAVVGTLAASFIMSFFLDLSIKEALAIGAGFGWYTLAPGIIMEAGYMTASAIAFLHNVMRELFSILFIPLVAKKIGYVETVGMPGAAAMDVCLPIIEKSTKSSIAVYSFVSGVILSILVPILVPLIIAY
jgi:uncharacterized membrane protein YbjE (DUF340 family)